MRKPQVRWTDRELQTVALRARDIMQAPELPENRVSSTGHICRSLAMAYRNAQLVLPEDRRKHPNNFSASSEKVATLHRLTLASIERNSSNAVAEAELAKRVEAEKAAALAKVEADKLNALQAAAVEADRLRIALAPFLTLKAMLIEVIEQGVAQGILRASEAQQVADAQVTAAAHGNGDDRHPSQGGADHRAPVAVHGLVAALLTPTKRIPVDVVGLKGGQMEVVEKSPQAAAFDIRFIGSNAAIRTRDLRRDVVICTKFVPHSIQNQYKAADAKIHYANGGAHSVIEALRHLEQTSKTAHH